MKRGGKPQQQIYKPGSGPLRKTGQNVEDTESDTAFVHSRQHYSKEPHYNYKQKGDKSNVEIEALDYKIGDLALKDDCKRKPKKPDQTFYVVKPQKAQGRDTPSINRSNDNLSSHVDNKILASSNNNGSESDHTSARSKRYSHRRRPSEDAHDKNWRSNSPNSQHRDVRQGSEPRALPHQPVGNWNRGVRDTRSVDPLIGPTRNYGGEKMYMKPPSGRRHSSVGLEQEKRCLKNIDSLPPRLKKKYLEENKLDVNYIGTQSEEAWDGNSITFKGSAQQHGTQQHALHNYPMKQPYPLPYSNMHMEPPYQNQPMDNYHNSYYTLPRRGRGRNRMYQEYDSSVGGSYRSVTPDRVQRISPTNSRPTTPLSYQHKTRSNENLYRSGNRAELSNANSFQRSKGAGGRRDKEEFGRRANDQNVPIQEAKPPPVAPSNPPPVQKEPAFTNTVLMDNNPILDWSEEVELQVRLDAEEALSDVVTRSSSMTSLVEPSTVSQPSSSRRKNKRSNSRFREHSGDNQFSSKHTLPRAKEDHNNYYNSADKIPEYRFARRKNSRDRNTSRESSFDHGENSRTQPENWREESLRNKRNTEREEPKDGEVKKGGIIVLPTTKEVERPKSVNIQCPRYPDIKKSNSGQQKSLFDPSNPSKPIIVKSSSARISAPGFSESSENSPPQLHQYITDQFGNVGPTWYDEKSESWKACHSVSLLMDIKQADYELQFINNSGLILINWETVNELRIFLMNGLRYLLCKDLKFCQTENVEQHFWRILYYNIIEMMRKAITNDPVNKKQYKEFLLFLIDEGTKYFEGLLDMLEQKYKFKVNDYLGYNSLIPHKGLGLVGLALISAQKIFLFLGDLVRYREQVNETSNYGKCRQWYIKAHEINPKNGRPYNQLAVLAVYARRKLDAVYYYMRSIMSSNPVPSAREILNSLFDENARKYVHQICYEQGERKRREERAEKARQHMKEKESETAGLPGSLRREIWIRPDGGRRVHRTTSAAQEPKHVDSEEEDLAALPCSEVNKRFVTSYLHVHGKLITKIGMETFQEAALQMLKEFRALLQHSPMPLNCNRFLQLLALNMFAIDSTQLKDPELQQTGYRSELQERALIISLQMFNLILERSISLLHEHIKLYPDCLEKLTMNSVSQDFHSLLPALKTWCDWMLCHSNVWNPPPSTQEYKIGPPGDVWTRLASIMNILEKFDKSIASSFVSKPREGYEIIRLPEDAVLSGFTPLMYNDHSPNYAPKDVEPELSQFALRLSKVHFFGTVFLYGLEEPVLKLEIFNGVSEYISVVSTSSNKDSPPSPVELMDDDDLLVESFSEDEGVEEDSVSSSHESTSAEIQYLINKKIELEKRHRTQELHRQRVQKILQQSVVSVHIEIRPKILVPDTNCFIDYMAKIKTIVDAHVYTLMVPLVVLNELEGLARGGKHPAPATRPVTDSQHILKVAESAKQALEYLGNRHNNIKCVTRKGTTLPTFTFTVEEDSPSDTALRNDDKILSTCLMLCKNSKDQATEGSLRTDAPGEPRKLVREVVLLTEDRNLRVKALARDLPVRELPDFLQWAGLG